MNMRRTTATPTVNALGRPGVSQQRSSFAGPLNNAAQQRAGGSGASLPSGNAPMAGGDDDEGEETT